MGVLFTILFALFAFTALRIWRPCKSPKPISDRLAWTVFAFGVCPMAFMAIYGMTSEGEGSGVRPWATIRLHTRLFLAGAALSISGPLIVMMRQSMSWPRFRIRTLMIVVALTAAILALTVAYGRGHHLHDFRLTVGPAR